jgi:hypothetical protein
VANYDGAVVFLGDGANMSTVCDKQLDVVYHAGKPTVGFYTWRFDYTYNMSFNSNAWPTAANDTYMKYLTRAMMSGTVQRKYSALIIDISQVAQTSTVNLSDQWVRDFAIKHLTDMVWNSFHIPVYIYFTPATYKLYKSHTADTDLPAFFKSIPADGALSTVLFSPVGSDGYPTDAASPVRDSSGNLIMDTGYWWFWLYYARPITWLFNGTKAKMINEFNFVAPSGSTTNPSTGTTPGSTTNPTDLATALSAISALQTAQASLTTQLTSLQNRFDALVSKLHSVD